MGCLQVIDHLRVVHGLYVAPVMLHGLDDRDSRLLESVLEDQGAIRLLVTRKPDTDPDQPVGVMGQIPVGPDCREAHSSAPRVVDSRSMIRSTSSSVTVSGGPRRR